MSLAVVPCGTEVGIDHFWDNVRRVSAITGIQAGYAGPFTLDEAMQIAWRVREFHIESDIESRPTAVDPYVPGGSISDDVGFGQQIGGTVSTPVEIEPAFANELEYASFVQFPLRTAYVSYGLATDIGGPGTALVQAFVARNQGSGPQQTFLYRDGDGFYIGVNLGYSGLSIPSNGDTTGLLGQTSYTFTFFGKTVEVYTTGSDAGEYSGTTTITAASYWPFEDSVATPIFNSATGAKINPNPLYMEIP